MRLSLLLSASAAAAFVTAEDGLASTTTNSEPAGPTPRFQFEIDIVFPRNWGLYNKTKSEVFPIVFAVQNLLVLQSLSPSTYISWGLHPIHEFTKDGVQNWGYDGIFLDEGILQVPDPSAVSDTGEPYIFVAATNITQWIRKVREVEKPIVVQLYIRSNDSACDYQSYGYTYDRVAFMMHLPSYTTPDDARVLDPVVQPTADGDPCPVPVALTSVGRNETRPECGITRDLLNLDLKRWTNATLPPEKAELVQPCNVKIDEVKASSIMSQATAYVAQRYEATRTKEVPLPTHTLDNAAAGPVMPLQTAFAAVVALGGLLL
jgi:hypothetical protein